MADSGASSADSSRMSRTAIFDATNSSVYRRRKVAEEIRRELAGQCRVVFVESVCDDTRTLERNLLQKVRMSADYADMAEADALRDLQERIGFYESQYESLSVGEHLSFIKLFNLSSQLHLNLIYGSVAKSLVPYMMGIHIGRRPIWLVRAAHCEGAEQASPPSTPGSQKGLLSSGSSKAVIVPRSAGLSEEGLLFAQRLGSFCAKRCDEHTRTEPEQMDSWGAAPAAPGSADAPPPPSPYLLGGDDGPGVSIFTSTLPRAVQTASFVPSAIRPHASSALNPLDRGTCYGLTEEEFAYKQPEIFAKWNIDMRHTRYPGGESYHDLVTRLEPTLIEIEQQTSPVLIVSHLSTLQVLYSYFTGTSLADALNVSIPNHTVLQITPSTSMWKEEFIPLTSDDISLASLGLKPATPATPGARS